MMTREQTIDAAVRDYAKYLRSIGVNTRAWMTNMLWYPWMLRQHYLQPIRFAYWRIKNEEEFRNR